MRCGAKTLSFARPHVMGILNVTPDSFSDGGQLYCRGSLDQRNLLARAQAMIDAGATVLDIGGESTRPGAEPVSVDEELARVIPAVRAISAALDVVVSVDTSTPEVMMAAADAGAGMLNDVRALERPGALTAAAGTGLPVCLMHMRGTPETMQDAPGYQDVLDDVAGYLRQRVAACEAAGITRERLLIDPGFGFGKTMAHNLRLLNHLEQLQSLGLPLLVGMSRKSMIGDVLNRSVEGRLSGSLAVAALAVSKGAWVVRVHDVAPTSDVVRMCAAVMNEGVRV